ncbi:hypothetical protein M0R72_15790 [Candidatus Pacearchaeota archaeon]|jgi:hypothetical protein|nr:hypothetical protein [Candidatus Pacearchaeota archaeon]
MLSPEQIKSLQSDHAARYAEWLKADQKAFDAREKNRIAERAFNAANEKERYDKRDLLKADPLLGNFMVNQTLKPFHDAWYNAEDEMNQAAQTSRQASILVDEVNKRIEICKIAAGLV